MAQLEVHALLVHRAYVPASYKSGAGLPIFSRSSTSHLEGGEEASVKTVLLSWPGVVRPGPASIGPKPKQTKKLNSLNRNMPQKG